MKTKEELNALKIEVETLSRKLAELTEEELRQVMGGNPEGNGSVCPCGYREATKENCYDPYPRCEYLNVHKVGSVCYCSCPKLEDAYLPGRFFFSQPITHEPG